MPVDCTLESSSLTESELVMMEPRSAYSLRCLATLFVHKRTHTETSLNDASFCSFVSPLTLYHGLG
jgi:hypothetical protein